MTPSFTPGPWKDSDAAIISAKTVTGDAKQLVALVYGANVEHRVFNARLIAAAPEMYELLADRHFGGNVWEDRILTIFFGG